MTKKLAIGYLAILLSSQTYAADRSINCDERGCQPKTKEVCFNVYCNYEFEGARDHEKKSCSAASTFTKKVSEQGAEIPETVDGNLEVKCDGQSWIGRADVFTGLLGTRLQGKTGPDPAVFLPRTALSSSTADHTQGHYTESGIEINDDGKFLHGHGKCYIWSTEKKSEDHHL